MKIGNFKRKKKLSKVSIYGIVGIFFLLAAGTGIGIFNNVKAEPVVTQNEKTATVMKKEESKQSFIAETCFDGTAEVNPALYTNPFQKTEYYINNKELVKIVPEEDITKLQERGTEIIMTLLGSDNREITNQYDEFKNKISGFFLDGTTYADEKGNHKEKDAYLAEFIKDLADAGFQAEVTCESDKSLVFQDISYHVRELVTITVYQYDETVDLSYMLPIKIQEGNTYQFIVDIGLVYPNDTRSADHCLFTSMEIIDVLAD